MTDSADPKKPSIPSWQNKTPEDASEPTPKDAGEENGGQDGNAVYEQAKIFLKDPSVRAASREKKVAFLEKKGLQVEEIEKLVDTASSKPACSAEEEKEEEESSLNKVDGSSAGPPSATNPSSTSTSSPAQSASVPGRAENPPPVITYPEFLLRPTKPPPLMTLESLSRSLYGLAGISALTYGASKYIVQPMLQSLMSARHDLSSTALHNLEKLNEKLECNVSHIPAALQSGRSKVSGGKRGRQVRNRSITNHNNDANGDGDGDCDGDSSDTSSLDSDPTEFFHRDVATQTSVPPSPSPSSSSSTPAPAAHNAEKADATTTQSAHLTHLSGILSSLLATESNHTAQTTLLDSISACQAYLARLQFGTDPHANYTNNNNHLLLYGQSATGDVIGKGGGLVARDEEAIRFKQEVRSLKGALLSVRNFPPPKPATPTLVREPQVPRTT